VFAGAEACVEKADAGRPKVITSTGKGRDDKMKERERESRQRAE
jgi:hypothetical protein